MRLSSAPGAGGNPRYLLTMLREDGMKSRSHGPNFSAPLGLDIKGRTLKDGCWFLEVDDKDSEIMRL